MKPRVLIDIQGIHEVPPGGVPRVLQFPKEEFISKGVLVDSAHIENPRGASHLKEYDVIVLGYEGIAVKELPERTKQLTQFLTEKKGILVVLLTPIIWERAPAPNHNYTPIWKLLKEWLGEPEAQLTGDQNIVLRYCRWEMQRAPTPPISGRS